VQPGRVHGHPDGDRQRHIDPRRTNPAVLEQPVNRQQRDRHHQRDQRQFRAEENGDQQDRAEIVDHREGSRNTRTPLGNRVR